MPPDKYIWFLELKKGLFPFFGFRVFKKTIQNGLFVYYNINIIYFWSKAYMK